MGHFYRSPISLVGIINEAADQGIWAVSLTSSTLSRSLWIWSIDLRLSNNGSAMGTAGDRWALRLQRSATVVLTGAAGVISPVVAGADATGATVVQNAAGLTGTPAGDILDYFSIAANVANSGDNFSRQIIQTEPGNRATPLVVVSGTRQLALVIDFAVPNTASLSLSVTGSITWEER